jgi:hypothetical protein
MPDYMRSATFWYEEDCQWSLVALKYPKLFKAQIGNDPGDRQKPPTMIAPAIGIPTSSPVFLEIMRQR